MSGHGYAGKLQAFIAGIVPWWLQNPMAGAFNEAIGLTLDLASETLLSGLRGSLPLRCFPDALPWIGADRGIRRYPNEPTSSYRRRCAQWRQIKRHAGSHYGQLINLQPYFLPTNRPVIRIVHQDGDGATATWHTLDAGGAYSYHRATPSNWNWDGATAQWSRFWVIVYVNGVGLAPTLWDDGALWDGGSIWDGYLTSDQISDIVEIVNEAKAPHSMLAGVILATDPNSFDPLTTSIPIGDGTTTLPTGHWGKSVAPFTGLPTRLATAIIAYDYALGP